MVSERILPACEPGPQGMCGMHVHNAPCSPPPPVLSTPLSTPPSTPLSTPLSTPVSAPPHTPLHTPLPPSLPPSSPPQDRVGLIHQLATLPAHPESVPINRLVAIKGTPMEVGARCVCVYVCACVCVWLCVWLWLWLGVWLWNRRMSGQGSVGGDQNNPAVNHPHRLCVFPDFLHTPKSTRKPSHTPACLQGNEAPEGIDLVRCVATARVVMPRTVVRLSAGRLDLSRADQVGGGGSGCGSGCMYVCVCVLKSTRKTLRKDSVCVCVGLGVRVGGPSTSPSKNPETRGCMDRQVKAGDGRAGCGGTGGVGARAGVGRRGSYRAQTYKLTKTGRHGRAWGGVGEIRGCRLRTCAIPGLLVG